MAESVDEPTLGSSGHFRTLNWANWAFLLEPDTWPMYLARSAGQEPTPGGLGVLPWVAWSVMRVW